MPLGLAASPVAGPIVAVALDGRILKWNRDTLEPEQTLDGCSGPVLATCFAGEQGYGGGNDGSVFRFNGAVVSAKANLGSPVSKIFALSSGLVAVCKDKTLRYLDFDLQQTGKVDVGEFALTASQLGKDNIVLGTKARSIMCYDAKGTQVWNRKAEFDLTAVAACENGITAVALEGQGNQMSIQTAPRPVVVFDAGGVEVARLTENIADVKAMCFSKDGTYLTVASDRNLRAYNCKDNFSLIDGSKRWVNHTSRVTACRFSDDGVHVASGSLDRSCIVWNCADPSKRIDLKEAHKEGVNDVAFVDNNTMVSAGQDGCLKFFKMQY